MAKRNFAGLAAVSVFAVLAANASAAEVPVSVDGCAVLARAVYSEVSAAALYGPGRSGPWLIDAGQGDIAQCSTTAKTVSRAFTSALRSAGINVDWSRNRINPGDYCDSHYLSQCYPDRGQPGYSNPINNTAFVQKTWSVVSQSVMRQMHNPFSSDEVRFRDSDLKLQLGLSLRMINPRETLNRRSIPNRR